MKLDKIEGKDSDVQHGEGMVLDRNEILKVFTQNKDSKDSKA